MIKTNSINTANLSFGVVGGSGKTYEVVQFLTYKAITEKCRILCLREFSNTNKSSLVSEFKNFIYANDLEAEFKERMTLHKKEFAIKILVSEIIFRHNGSQILFAGINDNTAMNLKSISNINICFVEEADFISEYAYNILKPTIRAKNSKIFYTFNPRDKEAFIYQKALANNNELCKCVKVNYYDNAEFPEVLDIDRRQNKKTMPPDLYAHIWLGEPLAYNDSQVINTDLIGYFDEKQSVTYSEVFITADTAYSKKEGADFSVLACFGKYQNEVRLLRVYRGRWDFNELQIRLKEAYLWVSEYTKKACDFILIEKKASGISLLQELQRTTHLPLSEITPKTDKYTRVSDILSELPRLKLPIDKENPLNSWIHAFLDELKMFRADLEHKHDDQVDALVYGLQYCKTQKVRWDLL